MALAIAALILLPAAATYYYAVKSPVKAAFGSGDFQAESTEALGGEALRLAMDEAYMKANDKQRFRQLLKTPPTDFTEV